MNSNMVKPEKYDNLHLIFHFTIPLMQLFSMLKLMEVAKKYLWNFRHDVSLIEVLVRVYLVNTRPQFNIYKTLVWRPRCHMNALYWFTVGLMPTGYPIGIYLLKVNNKGTRATPGVVLVSLLLTLTLFHILF